MLFFVLALPWTESRHPLVRGSISTNSVQIRPNLARLRANLAQIHQVCARVRPSLGRFRPSSARLRPDLAWIRPDLGELGRRWPDVGHLFPGFDQTLTVLKDIDPIWAKCCQAPNLVGFGRILPELRQLLVESAELVRLRPNSAPWMSPGGKAQHTVAASFERPGVAEKIKLPNSC